MARQSRHDELLDAALALWAESGYAAVGVKEITGHARVSHGTFYNYFESRRQMLDVLVDREAQRYLAYLDRAADEMVRPVTEASLRAEMARVNAEILHGIEEHLSAFAFILLDVAGIDDAALAGQVALFRDAGRRAGAILANAAADGVIDESVAIEFAGQSWVSAILGVVAPAVADGRRPDDVDEVARILADTLLDGVPESAALSG